MDSQNHCSERYDKSPLDRNRRVTDVVLLVAYVAIGLFVFYSCSKGSQDVNGVLVDDKNFRQRRSSDSWGSMNSEGNNIPMSGRNTFELNLLHDNDDPPPSFYEGLERTNFKLERFPLPPPSFYPGLERTNLKYSTDERHEEVKKNDGENQLNLSSIIFDQDLLMYMLNNDNHSSRSKYFPLAIVLFFFCSFFIFTSFDDFPKVWVYFCIIGLALAVAVFSLILFFGVPLPLNPDLGGGISKEQVDLIFRIFFSFCTLNSLVVLFNIYHVKVNTIVWFIKHSTRPVLDLPSIVLFTLCVILLKFLTIHCVISIFEFKKLTLNLPSYGIIVGLRFISYFLIMVIGQTVTTWHWMETKKGACINILIQSIKIVVRYHLISIFFASMSFIPAIMGIIIAFAGPRANMTHKLNILHYYTRILCNIIIIYYIEPFSLILVATQGLSFFRAAEKAFYLVSKNSSFFLTAMMIYQIAFETWMDLIRRNSHMIFDSLGPSEVAVYEVLSEIVVAASLATMFRVLEHDDKLEEELKVDNFEKLIETN